MLLVSFYTPWKHQKTSGFLIFPGGLERNWDEMGQDQCFYHEQTSQLICRTNEPTGFSMMWDIRYWWFSYRFSVIFSVTSYINPFFLYFDDRK